MTSEALSKGYEPADVEAKWIAYWQDEKTFTPDPDGPGEPYSIVIPPPNVTGALHMGHALNITIQDILCRYHRQRGRKVLLLDHAEKVGKKILISGGGRCNFTNLSADRHERFTGEDPRFARTALRA